MPVLWVERDGLDVEQEAVPVDVEALVPWVEAVGITELRLEGAPAILGLGDGQTEQIAELGHGGVAAACCVEGDDKAEQMAEPGHGGVPAPL